MLPAARFIQPQHEHVHHNNENHISVTGRPVRQPQQDPLNVEYHFNRNPRTYMLSFGGQPVQQPQEDPLNVEYYSNRNERLYMLLLDRQPTQPHEPFNEEVSRDGIPPEV